MFSWFAKLIALRRRTVIATDKFTGTRSIYDLSGINVIRQIDLMHIVVFEIDGRGRRSVRYENIGSDNKYHTELHEAVSNWINLCKLPDKATMADNERAAQFKLFWG